MALVPFIRTTITPSILLLAFLPGTCLSPAISPLALQSNAGLFDRKVIQAIDAAVAAREAAIAGYTVRDEYTVYRAGSNAPIAAKVVQVIYNENSGKTITTISESGSPFWRSTIIDRIVTNEQAMSSREARENALINSANYEIIPGHEKVEKNGHTCLIVDLRARRHTSDLINGKGWVDLQDFNLVHLEGMPADDPNVIVGPVNFLRDYANVDGLSMAVHAEAHAQSPLMGQTILTINSVGYQIRRSRLR
jgi:hypothetical protein